MTEQNDNAAPCVNGEIVYEADGLRLIRFSNGYADSFRTDRMIRGEWIEGGGSDFSVMKSMLKRIGQLEADVETYRGMWKAREPEKRSPSLFWMADFPGMVCESPAELGALHGFRPGEEFECECAWVGHQRHNLLTSEATELIAELEWLPPERAAQAGIVFSTDAGIDGFPEPHEDGQNALTVMRARNRPREDDGPWFDDDCRKPYIPAEHDAQVALRNAEWELQRAQDHIDMLEGRR